MSVTRAQVSEKEQYLAQIERLVNSPVLHGSESLCKLLRYLAEHELDHPGAHPKEYQIATEVFGRRADFDPQSDSTIRVQAGRLRLKLAEYYSSAGAEDPIVVELPKGSYALSFHHRVPGTAHPPSGPYYEKTSQRTTERRSIRALAVLSILLAAAVGVIVSLVVTRNSTRRELPAGNEAAPAVFRVFWKSFLSGSQETWVIFSNGAFVGRPEIGMRYFDPLRDSRNVILDHYTGVGEVLAVHELDRVFGLLRRPLRVKRGSLFSLDDAKNNDLIFVGSPAENLTLREIPSTQEVVFQRLDSGPRKGDLAVVNVHPRSGEPKFLVGSPSNTPLSEDYAVVALVQGLDPARSVLILAGTTTLGTEAAVEYVCEQNSLEKLLSRLSLSDTGEVKPFEAVLRVKVTRGVPVETTVVALRNRNP